jgi:hypothetical protein
MEPTWLEVQTFSDAPGICAVSFTVLASEQERVCMQDYLVLCNLDLWKDKPAYGYYQAPDNGGLWINITQTTWAEFSKNYGIAETSLLAKLQGASSNELAIADICFGKALRPDLLALLKAVRQGIVSGTWKVTAVDTTPPVYRKTPLRIELYEVKGWDPKSGLPPLPPVGER